MPDHVTATDPGTRPADAVDPTVLLVGAGPMAVAYAGVLDALGMAFEVVGRSERTCRAFQEATGVAAAPGGIEARAVRAGRAIVAVGVEQLGEVTLHLLDQGVTDLLVEKPAGLHPADLEALSAASAHRQARVLVAYNRRYYASALRARELVADDGGVSSFAFEFTEWPDRVAAAPSPATVKARWFLANSSHVVDLAFFLGGRPTDMACHVAGSLPWHPAASVFAGSGVADSGALFNYQADWEAPGRWGLELFTRRRRLVLRPLEQLWCQWPGSLDLEAVELDDQFDRRFKPGLYRQTEAFLSGGPTGLPSIHDQLRNVRELFDPMVAGMSAAIGPRP